MSDRRDGRCRWEWTAVFLIVFFWTGQTAARSVPTVIHAVRLGIHADYTRLVFDVTGPRPLQVIDRDAKATRIIFTPLKKSVADKHFSNPRSAVAAVIFKRRTDQGEVVVRHRTGNLKVKRLLLPSEPPRRAGYRLVLDFYPALKSGGGRIRVAAKGGSIAAKKAASGSIGSPAGKGGVVSAPVSSPGPGAGEGQSSPAIKLIHAGPEQTPTVKTLGEKVPKAVSPPPPRADESPRVAVDKPGAAAAGGAALRQRAPELFSQADAYYRDHRERLADFGTFVISRYQRAINADPQHPLVPRALFRCGESAYEMGGYVMAEAFLRRLNAQYPDSSYRGRAWLLLGLTRYRLEEYAEAVKAFQMALKGPLNRRETIEANYLLGTCLVRVGDHGQAVRSLEQCLRLNPRYYLTKPDLLRSLGDAHFALGDYDQSLKYLFWYLNISEDTKGSRNLVLARLAESFQHMGDPRLANKLYGYIKSYLPGSEGDVIARIREAERLAKKGKSGLQQALTVYQQLAGENVNGNLAELIQFRLAYSYWKLGDLQTSLNIVNKVISENQGSSTIDEFYTLKTDLVKGLIKEAFGKGKYLDVVALYRENRDLLRLASASELQPMIAKSYAELKLYPNAIALYRALAKQDTPHQDRWLLEAARCSLEMQQLDKAAGYCKAVRDSSLETEKIALMAEISFARKQYKQAASYFEKFLARKADPAQVDWNVLMDYSSCLMALGQYRKALVYLQKASRHPGDKEPSNHLSLCLLLGKCYQEMNQPRDALPFYEEALKLIRGPERKNYVTYKVAKLYKQVGNVDKARKMFSQLLSSNESLWQAVAREQLNDINFKNHQST